MTANCPVCGTPLVVDVSYLDEGTVAERYEECGLCRYRYEFAYGNTSEYIGEWMLHLGWNSLAPPEWISEGRRAAIRRRKEEMNLP